MVECFNDWLKCSRPGAGGRDNVTAKIIPFPTMVGLTDEQIEGQAALLSSLMMELVSAVTGSDHADARMVMIACGSMAGSWAYGIKDPEVKREILARFISTFQVYAGNERLPQTESAAADVIERVASYNSSDPATDDLTVPLAIQLAETEQKLREATAARAIASIPPHLYWLMGKGRTRPKEPLHAVQLIDPESGIAIAEAEAEQLADAIAAAIKKLPEAKS